MINFLFREKHRNEIHMGPFFLLQLLKIKNQIWAELFFFDFEFRFRICSEKKIYDVIFYKLV